MAISYGLGIIGLGVLLIIVTQLLARGQKGKGTRVTFLWIGGIIAVIGIIGLAGVIPTLEKTFTVPEIQGPLEGGIELPKTGEGEIPCAQDAVTATLSGQDKFTSIGSTGTHRYRICNTKGCAPSKAVSDGGTLSASAGDILEVLYGNATSTTYFGVFEKYLVPCAPTVTFWTSTVQNGTGVTINIYNEEGNQIDGTTTNETIGSGESSTMKVEMRAASQKGFPHGGVMVLELNGTAFDEEKTTLSFNDLTLTPTSVPGAYQIGYLHGTVKTLAWDVSPFEDSILHSGTLFLQAASGKNPTMYNEPMLTFIAKDYYIDETKGAIVAGPAAVDEVGAYTFPSLYELNVSII